MRGELSSGKFSKRHPLDWYVDPYWCAGQLRGALDNFALEFEEGLAIWDPSCGQGNSIVNIAGEEIPTYASDVVDRFDHSHFDYLDDVDRPVWFSADFLECTEAPAPCSIVCNPPYSYKKGIAEAFARHALKLTSRRVCLLLPNKWLASQVRFNLFQEHPPQAILHLTQRASMPPGDRIKLMGNRAFRGGMIDYCWIIWDVKRPTNAGETRTIWLPPLGYIPGVTPIEGIA